jgi:hypothetical protein
LLFSPLLLIPLFPVPFAAFWQAITGILGPASGGSACSVPSPTTADRAAAFPVGRDGRGDAGESSCFTLDIFATGLRISVLRLVGPFQRPSFVPWSNIWVGRRRIIFRRFCELSFGTPVEGNLLLSERTVRRIAAVAPLRYRRAESRRAPTERWADALQRRGESS